MGTGLKIAIREPILKTSLSLALINQLKKTLFDVELWMTQNRLLAWYLFVLDQKQKKRIRW